jgi:hypothetical protein
MLKGPPSGGRTPRAARCGDGSVRCREAPGKIGSAHPEEVPQPVRVVGDNPVDVHVAQVPWWRCRSPSTGSRASRPHVRRRPSPRSCMAGTPRRAPTRSAGRRAPEKWRRRRTTPLRGPDRPRSRRCRCRPAMAKRPAGRPGAVPGRPTPRCQPGLDFAYPLERAPVKALDAHVLDQPCLAGAPASTGSTRGSSGRRVPQSSIDSWATVRSLTSLPT